MDSYPQLTQLKKNQETPKLQQINEQANPSEEEIQIDNINR